MQDNLTVKDAVRFILDEPRVLKSWRVKDIYRIICKAISEHTFFYHRDVSNNKLCGIVIADYDKKNNRFHVYAMKCTRPNIFKIFVREFYRRYPGVRLTAYRYGEFKEYERKIPC